MSIVNDKFLPTSLSGILASLETLRDSIDVCTEAIQNFDVSELSTRVENISDEVSRVKDDVEKIESRVDNVESNDAGNTDLSALENRVDQLEVLTDQFFDA